MVNLTLPRFPVACPNRVVLAFADTSLGVDAFEPYSTLISATLAIPTFTMAATMFYVIRTR